MKLILLSGLLLFAFLQEPLNTSKYAGTYSYGKNNKGGIGTILIYPETDSTILFFVDLHRGAPSYNMGSLYGRVKIYNGNGTFYKKPDLMNGGCKWNFQFSTRNLTITTVDGQYDCGFGHAVYADGIFKRISNKTPDYFVTGEGTKGYFKTTAPEAYN